MLGFDLHRERIIVDGHGWQIWWGRRVIAGHEDGVMPNGLLPDLAIELGV
jgi:hypothetical protein